MMKDKLIKIFFFSLVLFFSSFSFSYAQSDGINIDLTVGSICNNNSVCGVGEDVFNCPADCPAVVIPPPGGGRGRPLENFFQNLTVEVKYTSVIIKWESPTPTITNLKWGTDQDYKDGSLRNINYLIYHKVQIDNLEDGTLYYFTIFAESLLGNSASLGNQFFTTLSLPDTTPPGNPTNLKAVSTTAGVTISWTNPRDVDFNYIRVMRNEGRFYGSPNVGRLVYEGKGNYFTDGNVKANTKYFYSLFSRDLAGNYSSGSLISIVHNRLKIDPDEVVVPPPVITLPPGDKVPPGGKIEPVLDMYIVEQGATIYDFNVDSILSLSGDEPINVKTNYSRKDTNDDVWLEIRNANKEVVGQFFFSRMIDKEGFSNVRILSFERAGKYDIGIFRYVDNILEIVNIGTFQISKITTKEVTLSQENKVAIFIIFGLLLLIFLLLLLFLKHRKNKGFIQNL